MTDIPTPIKSVSKPKHDHAQLKFPSDFLWGAGTSAYQVEGNNLSSDWWQWEETHQPPGLRSGQACDQYHLYEQDFALAKELNHNAHRLSIEWSRIEPTEGQFDQNEIDHYKQVLKSLKDQGFTVMLTLHHFTNPLWFAQKGGWENLLSPYKFERFVKKIVPELKEYVDLWITINEPGVYVLMGNLGGDGTGTWPPDKKSNWAAIKTTWNMARAHKKAYTAIHHLVSNAQVGITQSFNSFEAYHKHSIVEQLAVIMSDLFANHIFYWMSPNHHDFIGVNYYFNHRFKSHGLKVSLVDDITKRQEVSDLGWEIYPEGLFNILADVSDGLPIYVTECGIASTNDDRRTRFLINYLQEVYRAVEAGIKVKGFFYWSLIDNFEWHRGFEPRFGLVEVDYTTQKRIPRSSAKVYAEIIRHNGIEHKLLKLLGHGINVEKELATIMKKDH